jgi:broad specificity phosphatase PhoE
MSSGAPSSVLRRLSSIPSDRAVALLLRHAERLPLDLSEGDYTRPITAEGAALARRLGDHLGARLRTLRASPLTRCVQTAEALREGASARCEIALDRMLGDPGVYVTDDRLAHRTWIELGHEAVMEFLAGTGEAPLPGLAEPSAAARRLIEHMLAPERGPGLHAFVTHDSLVVATVARVVGKRLERCDWPRFLEGAFFWRGESGITIAYRES